MTPSFASNNDEEIRIRPAAAGQLPAALDILCGGFVPHVTNPDGLLVGMHASRLIAAAWLQTVTDQVAAVWPPRFADQPPGEPSDEKIADEIQSRLVQSLTQACHKSQFRIIRSLLRVDETNVVNQKNQTEQDNRSLAQIGLTEHTRIKSLYTAIDDQPTRKTASETEETRLVFHQVATAETNSANQSFSKLLTATCRDSLDCPEIVEALSADALLDGYAGHSAADSRMWFQVANENAPDDPIAALIMSDNTEDEQIDLLYLGIAPAFRGKGMGMQILGFAKSLAWKLGHRRIILSVDVRNVPAVNLYRKAEFVPYAEHRLFAMVNDENR